MLSSADLVSSSNATSPSPGDAPPTFRVYSAVPRDGKSEDWFEIGLAYPQPDGRGLVVMLQAQPLNPKLLLRAPAEKPHAENRLSLAQQVEAFERAIIERCLMETGGRINAVMELLDIPRRTLSEKMARLGINRRRFLNAMARRHSETGVTAASDAQS